MPTLIAYDDDAEIFSSDGKWLHPLLELRAFLQKHPVQGRLRTYDRVVGRASALLSAEVGVCEIRTDVVSARAIPVLEEHGIWWSATETQPRILCVTEDLLAEVTDPAVALAVIQSRIAARDSNAD